MTTQIAVKLPDEVVARVDGLVSEGAFPSRSAAVRHGLQLILSEHRRRSIDQGFCDGYASMPEADEELREAQRLAVESIEEELWEKWW